MKRILTIFIIMLFVCLPLVLAQENATAEWYTNMIYGSVEYSNGTPVESGSVKFVPLSGSITECAISRGSFNCMLSGPANITFYIFIGEYDQGTYTLITDDIDQNLRFVLPTSPPANNFPDEDRDGIPDDKDYCLGSQSTLIDAYGCTCAQKIDSACEGPSCCQEVDGIKKCIVNEEKIPICISELEQPIPCTTPNQCLLDTIPKYCSGSNILIDNCSQCSCPATFTCQPDTGKCVKTIGMKGLKCKKTPYKVAFSLFRSPNHYCRHKYGPEWIAERSIKKMLDIPQVRNLAVLLHFIAPLEWTLFMTIPLYITVCVRTEDQGCVPSDTSCPGEAELPETIEYIEKEIKRRSNIKVSLDRADFKISELYTCPAVQITSDLVCKKIVDNGASSEKIDILFVGDGFMSKTRFDDAVAKITDADGDNSYFGIFSEEPFKSNKDKFNVWSVNGKDMIGYHTVIRGDGEGVLPRLGDVNLVSKACPISPDQVIVLSIQEYRSAAYTTENIALCSVGGHVDASDSRLVLHEFGHSFGKLGDEYHNYVEAVEEGDVARRYATFGPNCQVTQEGAVSVWGHLVGTGEDLGKIGYFSGCGDDCGDECYSFVRPTESSVMRDLTARNYQDKYVGYYTINKQLVEEEIRKAAGSVVSTTS